MAGYPRRLGGLFVDLGVARIMGRASNRALASLQYKSTLNTSHALINSQPSRSISYPSSTHDPPFSPLIHIFHQRSLFCHIVAPATLLVTPTVVLITPSSFVAHLQSLSSLLDPHQPMPRFGLLGVLYTSLDSERSSGTPSDVQLAVAFIRNPLPS
jgi:hypothetical protein